MLAWNIIAVSNSLASIFFFLTFFPCYLSAFWTGLGFWVLHTPMTFVSVFFSPFGYCDLVFLFICLFVFWIWIIRFLNTLSEMLLFYAWIVGNESDYLICIICFSCLKEQFVSLILFCYATFKSLMFNMNVVLNLSTGWALCSVLFMNGGSKFI